MRKTRNVLFIVIDQLRADCLFGDLAAHVDLPNMRALAEDSVRFDQHFSVVNPCGPSRASILTGQYAMNHRSIRNGTPLRHDLPTIATQARKAGYLPLLFGYTDTSQDPRAYPANDPALKSYESPMSGFCEMTEMRLEMSYPWRAHLLEQGYGFEQYWDLYRPTAAAGETPRLNDPAIYRAQDSDTAFLTDAFLHNIAPRQHTSWFAHLTYIRPHPPLVAPAPYNTLYDPATLPLPKRGHRAQQAQLHPFIDPAMRAVQPCNMVHGFPDLRATDEHIQTLRALYLGLATEVDQHIGRIIDYLRDSGQYDNTLIVLSADHGEMLGDHHAWGKMHVYDAAYHTPLFIRSPDHPAQFGQVVSAFTESIDVTPTILDWLGAHIPNSMDGHSLMPWLEHGTSANVRQYAYSELDFGHPTTATSWQQALGTTALNSNFARLRDARFTLVEFAAELAPILFDHHNHGEMENVAGQPQYQADLHRLTRQLLKHQMQHREQSLAQHLVTNEGVIQGTRHGSK